MELYCVDGFVENGGPTALPNRVEYLVADSDPLFGLVILVLLLRRDFQRVHKLLSDFGVFVLEVVEVFERVFLRLAFFVCETKAVGLLEVFLFLFAFVEDRVRVTGRLVD